MDIYSNGLNSDLILTLDVLVFAFFPIFSLLMFVVGFDGFRRRRTDSEISFIRCSRELLNECDWLFE